MRIEEKGLLRGSTLVRDMSVYRLLDPDVGGALSFQHVFRFSIGLVLGKSDVEHLHIPHFSEGAKTFLKGSVNCFDIVCGVGGGEKTAFVAATQVNTVV